MGINFKRTTGAVMAGLMAASGVAMTPAVALAHNVKATTADTVKPTDEMSKPLVKDKTAEEDAVTDSEVAPEDAAAPVDVPEKAETKTPAETAEKSTAPSALPSEETKTAETVATAAETPAEATETADAEETGTPVRVHHYSQDMDTEKFIALVGEQAREVGQERNIYASVMIAQSILESGSGTSSLAAEYNNLFGIKGEYNGNGVSFNTQEDDGTGNLYTTGATFRAYDNISQSMQDYADLIRNSGYYDAAWKENAATPEDAASALQGTYATDTAYAQKIMDIIDTYDLTEFDKPLEYRAADSSLNYSRTIAAILANATSANGEDYVWGGESFAEGGFDCSGLVQYAYTNGVNGVVEIQRNGESAVIDTNADQSDAQANAIVDGMRGLDALAAMPRTAQDQAGFITEDVPLDTDELLPGDTLYWQSGGEIYHTAIYLGRGYVLEAGNTETGVHVISLEDAEPSFARRVISAVHTDAETAEYDAAMTRQELGL